MILPLCLPGRTYGGIVFSEDPEREPLASEERGQLRVLTMRLAGAIAVLRARKYEALVASMLRSSSVGTRQGVVPHP